MPAAAVTSVNGSGGTAGPVETGGGRGAGDGAAGAESTSGVRISKAAATTPATTAIAASDDHSARRIRASPACASAKESGWVTVRYSARTNSSETRKSYTTTAAAAWLAASSRCRARATARSAALSSLR